MSAPRSEPRVVHFGVFEVDISAGELRKQGRRIRLQEQPLQVLEPLLSRPGQVVTREEMQHMEDTGVVKKSQRQLTWVPVQTGM